MLPTIPSVQSLQKTHSMATSLPSHAMENVATKNITASRANNNTNRQLSLQEQRVLLNPLRHNHVRAQSTQAATPSTSVQMKLRNYGGHPNHQVFEHDQRYQRVLQQQVAMAHEAEMKKNICKDTYLRQLAHENYLDKYEVLDQYYKRKWSDILRLHKFMTQKRFVNISLSGNDRSLYETFFRSFPQNNVSRSRFICVMRDIYDFQKKDPEHHGNSELLKLLNSLYYCFAKISDHNHKEAKSKQGLTDAQESKAQLNWKVLLCALRVLRYPQKDMIDHFKWAFQVFSSDGAFEVDSQSKICKKEMYEIFTACAGNARSRSIIAEKIQQAEDRMNPPTSNKQFITFSAFCELLQQTPIQALMEKATSYTTYYIELCHPLMRDFLYDFRQSTVNDGKLRMFLKQYGHQYARKAMNTWKHIVFMRKRARKAVKVSFSHIIRSCYARGFHTWMRVTIMMIATQELQRVYRGYRGRCKAHYAAKLVESASIIQRSYRNRSFFGQRMKKIRALSRSAIRIQKTYRGFLGRNAARNRLMEIYKEELGKIKKEREEFQAIVREKCAIKIQDCVRVFLQRKHEQKRQELEEAKRIVEGEMEQALRKAQREEHIYEQQITEYYNKLRAEKEYSEQRKIVDAKEKEKVILLRRKKDWEQFKKEREKLNKEKIIKKQRLLDELRADWSQRVEVRAQERLEKLEKSWVAPDGDEEKQLHSDLRAKIAYRAKLIEHGYKTSGVVMHKTEITERAQQEIMAEAVEEERERVRQEGLQAEEDFQTEQTRLEMEERKREIDREKAARGASTKKIQNAYRIFHGRKVLRERIRQVYRKEFDTTESRPVYINTRTGQRSWTKPVNLGSEDLVMVDQWVLTKDRMSGKPYYFNPFQIRQSWTKPAGVVLCAECDLRLASLWSRRCGGLCGPCYDRLFQNDNSWSVGLQAFNGAVETAEAELGSAPLQAPPHSAQQSTAVYDERRMDDGWGYGSGAFGAYSHQY